MAPVAAPTPNPLAPLTNQQITNQATNTISKAYAPAYASLGQQTKTAQGISDKRAADNRYYQSWLDTQNQALQAHADAAHQQLQGMEQSLMAQQNSLYAAQPGQLVQGAQSRAGNVSNNAQSHAFGADLNANQDYNKGLMQNAELSSVRSMGTQNQMLDSVRANNTALIQNAESKRIADLNTAMTGIANSRSKLDLSKTADLTKEIARLQGVEISKAQSNRSYAAAAAKLGISASLASSLINTRAGQLKVAQQNSNISLTRAQNAQMNADRNYNLNKSKFDAATAKDIYLRDHGLGPYKVAAGKSPKPLSAGSQNVYYKQIDKTKALLESLINQHGYTPQQAYQLVRHGGQYKSYTSTGGALNTTTQHYTTLSPNAYGDQILNAAYNARSGGTGLSPGDILALEHLGLTEPENRYGAARGTKTPSNGTKTPKPSNGGLGAAAGAISGAASGIGQGAGAAGSAAARAF